MATGEPCFSGEYCQEMNTNLNELEGERNQKGVKGSYMIAREVLLLNKNVDKRACFEHLLKEARFVLFFYVVNDVRQ